MYTKLKANLNVFDEDGAILERDEKMSHDEISSILDAQISAISGDIIALADLHEGWAETIPGAHYDLYAHSILVETTSLAILSSCRWKNDLPADMEVNGA